jgi:hypothetical protein
MDKRKIYFRRSIPKKARLRFFLAKITAIAIYGCQVWNLRARHVQALHKTYKPSGIVKAEISKKLLLISLFEISKSVFLRSVKIILLISMKSVKKYVEISKNFTFKSVNRFFWNQ